jgi:putative Mg2+ transporter-C (MgtC) family protein
MDALSLESLEAFWSVRAIEINIIVFLNLLGACLLGLLVGYERSYHGRAAGMRTYAIVCMASAGLTVFSGYPEYWYGSHIGAVANADPTRVVQGIVTGVGFLGAGVIMKEGFNISGLTTAASIWASSAIGVLIGVGFYAAAILLSILSAGLMMWGGKLEHRLPSRHAVAIALKFKPGFPPSEKIILRMALERGYEVASGSYTISYENSQAQWNFIALALSKEKGAPLAELAKELAAFEGIERFQLSHARN